MLPLGPGVMNPESVILHKPSLLRLEIPSEIPSKSGTSGLCGEL